MVFTVGVGLAKIGMQVYKIMGYEWMHIILVLIGMILYDTVLK
jgi:hypothetical protein